MIARVIDHRGATTAFPALALAITDRRGGEVRVIWPMMQFRQCLGQIIGMDLLVRCIFELHLPAVWWRRGWGDKEQLPGVRESQVLVFDLDGGRLAEVDLHALAHDGLAVEDLADADRGVIIVEGDDDSAEGFQGRPGVDGSGGVDEVFDGLEVVGAEDLEVVQVCDDEGIRWRSWLLKRRDCGEVEGERGA